MPWDNLGPLNRSARLPADIGARGRVAPLGTLNDQPGSAKPAPKKVRLVYPPWERPIQSALNTYAETHAQILAAVAGTVLQGPIIEVPDGYSYVVRGLNIFVANPLFTFDVDFILRYNQRPLGPIYRTFGRVASSLEVPFTIVEYGRGPGVLDIIIVNKSGAGPWTVGASFGGWNWPTMAGELAYGKDD